MNRADVSRYVDNLDLQLEERHRSNCPSCDGHNTFTVTRTTSGVLYNCYKAGCNLSGASGVTIRVSDMVHKDAKMEKEFVLPDYVVRNRPEIQEWATQWNLDANHFQLQYDVKENRVVFPVYNKHKIVDATGRATSKKVAPKWKRYGTSSLAYTTGNGPIAVLVEDVISAAVISLVDDNCMGVAILGTSLLSAHVEQLQACTGIIVALDPDAARKTLEFTRQLRGELPNTRVYALNLEDDLKYRRKNDIVNVQECIRRKIWN